MELPKTLVTLESGTLAGLGSQDCLRRRSPSPKIMQILLHAECRSSNAFLLRVLK
jgi:hypothetical protein